MKIVKLLFAAVILATGFNSFAQTGEIHGKVIGGDTKEALPGAYIYIIQGATKTATSADLDGNYKLKALNPGKYKIGFSFITYDSLILTDVTVYKNEIVFQNATLRFANNLPTVTIVGKAPIPLLFKGNPGLQKIDGKDLTKTAFAKDPKAGITSMFSGLTMVPGTTGQISVRGARPVETAYYVDGVKTPDGNLNVPGISISTIQVYTSGVPAQYGDVTGGVIAIETKSYFDLLTN